MINLKKLLAGAMALAMVTSVVPATTVNAVEVSESCTDSGVYFTRLETLEAYAAVDYSELTAETTLKEAGLNTVVTSVAATTPVVEYFTEGAGANALNYFVATASESNDAYACASTYAEYKANRATAKEILDAVELVAVDVPAALDITDLTAAANAQIDAEEKDAEAIADVIDDINDVLDFYEENEAHLTENQAKTVKTNVKRLNTLLTKLEKVVPTMDANEALAALKEIFPYEKKTISYVDAEYALEDAEDFLAELSTKVQNNYKVKKFMTAAEDTVDYAMEAAEIMEEINDELYWNENEELFAEVVAGLTANGFFTVGDDEAEEFEYELDVELDADDVVALKDLIDTLSAFIELDTDTVGRYNPVTVYYLTKGEYYSTLTGWQEDMGLGGYVLAATAAIEEYNDIFEAIEELTDVILTADEVTEEVEDAWTELKEYTDYMTDEEIGEVTTAYYQLKYGTTDVVVKSGWVNLGDGNWDYFDKEGKPVTGWVAAGSDWYYVKNGHMLRNSWIAKDATGAVWYYVGNNGAMVSNTVVDGYTINANGEWHA